MTITRGSKGLTEELEWATTHALGRTPKVEIYKMVLAIVYYVWQERNNIIFKKATNLS